MEQYEKSGPKPDPVKKEESDNRAEIRRLEKLCAENSALIDDLQKEIRRIKSKLDAHALTINQIKRNG